MRSFLRIFLSVMLFLGMIAVGLPVSFAEKDFPDASESPGLQLKIELFDSPETYSVVLELSGYSEQPYLLFLPAECDRAKLRPVFDSSDVTVDGTPLQSGKPTDVFAEDGIHTVCADGNTFSLRVVSSAELPSVFISTQSGSLSAVHADKEYHEPGYISTVEDGKVILNHTRLSFMKGHGNSSWLSGNKRSYTIKFDKKTPFLGMKEAKKWVLVSNTMDPTLLRNAATYFAAKQTSVPYTVDCRFVDLYVNGNYRGNYLVCEKVEVDHNRVDIDDLKKENEEANPDIELSDTQKMTDFNRYPFLTWNSIPNDPSDFSGGYLLEYDYPEEMEIQSSAFLTEYGSCLVLHTPEYATEQEIRYISDLYACFEEALLAKDGRNSQGKHYTEYIDADSFADGILLYELTQNQDKGYSSWYTFLPKGSQTFYMGPLWDFDQAYEHAENELQCIRALAMRRYDNLRAAKQSKNITFIDLLCSHRDFIDTLARRFAVLEKSFLDLPDQINEFSVRNAASVQMNNIRWGISRPQQADDITSYLTVRIQKMHDTFSDPDEQVSSELQRIRKDKGYATNPRTWPSAPESHPHIVVCIIVVSAVSLGILTTTFILIRKKKRKTKH